MLLLAANMDDIPQKVIHLVYLLILTPMAIANFIKAHTQLSINKNSPFFIIDFYVYHLIMLGIWVIYGVVNIYFTCGVILILLDVVSRESEQLSILLKGDSMYCLSDFFIVFGISMFGYCAVLLPINWLEIATMGYVAARDVSHKQIVKVMIVLSLAESTFTMSNNYGLKNQISNNEEASAICLAAQRIPRHYSSYGKFIVLLVAGSIMSVMSILSALNTRYQMIDKPQQWKHITAITFEKEYFPRIVRQLSLHFLTCLCWICFISAHFWPALYSVVYSTGGQIMFLLLFLISSGMYQVAL